MRQIFLANPKGGCGKSTLSIHLASYYAKLGYSVALCDHDPQSSSVDWVKCRPANLTPIQGIEFFKHNILTNRFDVAIHDMPAACDIEDLSKRIKGHQLLIPVLPSPTDIRACVRFLMALNRANLVQDNNIALIANRVVVRTNFAKVLMAFLSSVNLPLIGYLRDTQNYVRTINAGVSIFDLPAQSVSFDQEQWEGILCWLEETHTAVSAKQPERHTQVA